jgi:hypothetical protein
MVIFIALFMLKDKGSWGRGGLGSAVYGLDKKQRWVMGKAAAKAVRSEA